MEHEYGFTTLSQTTTAMPLKCRLTRNTGVQKVLKPDVFQNFELSEKTIISHNVAMSVKPPLLCNSLLTCTAIDSNYPPQVPSSAYLSVSTSPSPQPCLNLRVPTKKSSDPIHQSRATTNLATSTSLSSPTLPVISRNIWLRSLLGKPSRLEVRRELWSIHPIW